MYAVNDVVRLVRMPANAGVYRILMRRLFVVREYERSPAGRDIYTLEPVFRLSAAENASLGHTALRMRVQGGQLEGTQAVYVDVSA